MVEERIYDLLEAKFAEPEFMDCFLIELKLHPNRKLEVAIDSDGGVTFEKCQRISRYLESHLDEQGWLGEDYNLEVSSPGASRPLKLWRQYPKHVGRTLEVTLADGLIREGKLLAVTDAALTLEEVHLRQEGKRKVKETLAAEIPADQIKHSIVKITF